ncbi:DUF956 family protein [Catenibacterium sp.]|uniref:DUF956 family protein n=1 Tax=Catenibacterium sp. TaxID=2049022 RepID=UPI00399A175D
MAQSQNTKVDYSIKATSLNGLTNYGDVMVGDKAFEFYNEKNKEDFIQIPWEEIDYISASVYFNKKIARFAIFTKNNGHFTFSTRDNVKTLQVVGNHFPKEKMYRSPTFFTIIKRGLRYIFDSNYRHKVNGQA